MKLLKDLLGAVALMLCLLSAAALVGVGPAHAQITGQSDDWYIATGGSSYAINTLYDIQIYHANSAQNGPGTTSRSR